MYARVFKCGYCACSKRLLCKRNSEIITPSDSHAVAISDLITLCPLSSRSSCIQFGFSHTTFFHRAFNTRPASAKVRMYVVQLRFHRIQMHSKKNGESNLHLLIYCDSGSNKKNNFCRTESSSRNFFIVLAGNLKECFSCTGNNAADLGSK